MNMTWLFGGAIISSLLMAWQYIRGLWSYAISYVIVSHSLDTNLVEQVVDYMDHKYPRSQYGSKMFQAMYAQFKKASGTVELVAYENTARASLYWKGYLPFRIGRKSPSGSGAGHNYPDAMEANVTYIRGTFDIDQIIIEAMERYNKIRHTCGNDRRRFNVTKLGGNWSLADMAYAAKKEGAPGIKSAALGGINTKPYYAGMRPLGWNMSDIGIDVDNTCRISDLALSRDAAKFVEATKRWYASREWYKEHRVPWKMGARLVGLPGCGKTGLTRSLAYELDLPVYLFDLATMTNDDLREAWSIAMSSTPCMTVFEDIDAVFNGRVPVNKSPLTFDTLLQCLDGVEQHDGVLTIVTTNYADRLDPALTRAGRTDFELEMLPPDEEGCRKIAERIVGDWPASVEKMIALHCGKTGAEFQLLCTQEALAQYWKADYSKPEPELAHVA